MRILCSSPRTEMSPATTRLVMEWAAITGDSVVLARAGPEPPEAQWRSVEIERREHAPTTGARLASMEHTSAATVCFKTIGLAATPTASALAAAASPSSTRMIVVDALESTGDDGDRIGRFAEAVAEVTPVPTLVVRDAEVLQQWLRGSLKLHVYCAHGLSATSDAALGFVKELQNLADCTVTVGHVGRLGDERSRLGIRHPVDLCGCDPEVERILARDLRERIVDVIGANAGVEIDISGTWGRPDFEIMARARQAKAGLLVVGTHQRRGIQRALHPSVSRTTLRHSTMNLLVVPPPSRVDHCRIRAPLRLLVATDFSEAGDFAVKHAYALAQPDSLIRLVHVAHPWASTGSRFVHRIAPPWSRTQHLDYIRLCVRRLRSLVQVDATSRGIVSETVVLEHATPADAIVEESERFGADVIYLGTRGRTGLSAVVFKPLAQRVVCRSSRPLFLVHAPKR